MRRGGAGRAANPRQCSLFSLYFSFGKRWVGQLGATQKTCGSLQGICSLGGELGSSAPRSAVFAFGAGTLPTLAAHSCRDKAERTKCVNSRN